MIVQALASHRFLIRLQKISVN